MSASSDRQVFVAAIDDLAPSPPEGLRGLRSCRKTTIDVTARLTTRFNGLIRAWVKRRRERQELVDLLAEDHRIAGDMRSTEEELKTWARRPFWRP